MELTESEKSEWNRVVTRFDKVCSEAHQKNVPLLIDAEESWMQDAADDLVAQMMKKYNKEKAIVFNTLQMYRWDRLDYLKNLHQQAKTDGFYIGMKIVRGAYMEKERERAAEKGYTSPIQPDKESTDRDSNEALKVCVDHIDNDRSNNKLLKLDISLASAFKLL